MLSLQLLGGLTLSDESGPHSGPASQRRRLALLARIAAAPRASIGREKLIACFWPDEERERGRHFLADSVFALRKALGKEILITGADDLRLSRELIACDLWSFQEARDMGDAAGAVSLYRGPFLDGFFVADAPEFERWVEEERGLLARRFAETLERAAREVEEREGATAALTCWRRLAAHDPFSSRVALELMRCLAASGERASALQHARIHAALLGEQLGMPPDHEVERYAASLLVAPAASSPPVAAAAAPLAEVPGHLAAPPLAGPSADGEAGASSTAVPPAAGEVEERRTVSGRYDPPPVSGHPSPLPRPPHRAAVLVPLVLVVLLGTLGIWLGLRGSGEPASASAAAPTEVRTVVILPFAYQGPPEHDYLSEGLVTLLATSLHGATNLRPLDTNAVLSRAARDYGSAATPIPLAEAGEIAAGMDADLILLGSVAASGEGFRLSASLYRPGMPPQRIRTAAIEGAGPAELVDRLARDLLVGELRQPADRLTLVAAATTASISALKAYLEGEQAFRAARYEDAMASLERAVKEDPSFALAHYRLSTAAEWNFRFADARRAAREALELSTGLPVRDRRLVGAWQAFVHGDADRAESLYNAILTDNPGDVEARSGLAEVLVHFNAVRGRQPSEARPHLERVLRVAPDFGEARFHLMEMAAERGDLSAFDSLLAAVDPVSTQGQAWRLARQAVELEEASIATLVDTVPTLDDLVIGVAAVRTAAHFRDLDAAGALASALTRPERPASWRAAGLIMSAQGSLARGDLAEANRALLAARDLEPGWALEIAALGLLLPSSSPSAESLRRTRDDLEAWDPRAANPEIAFFFGVHADAHAELRLYLLTLLELRLNDHEQAARHLAELRGRGDGASGIGSSLAASAAAHRAWSLGDAEETLRILEADQPEVPLERIALSPFFARALDRYLRAEVLEVLGRPFEALRWQASLTAGPDLLFWTAAHRRQAELLRDAGQVAAARMHEQRYRSLLDPPPVLTNANQVRPSERLFPIPRADAVGR